MSAGRHAELVEAEVARARAATIRSAIPPSTTGCCSAAPKSEPVSAAVAPSAVNVRQMPSDVRRRARQHRARARRRRVRPPKNAIVTEISGYTHGVRLSAMPSSADPRRASTPQPAARDPAGDLAAARRSTAARAGAAAAVGRQLERPRRQARGVVAGLVAELRPERRRRRSPSPSSGAVERTRALVQRSALAAGEREPPLDRPSDSWTAPARHARRRRQRRPSSGSGTRRAARARSRASPGAIVISTTASPPSDVKSRDAPDSATARAGARASASSSDGQR